MKKQMSLFVWAVAVFGMSSVFTPAFAAVSGASSADLSGEPGVRVHTKVNYQKYETRSTSKTFAVKDNNNIYYTQPSKRSALYKAYDSNSTNQSDRTSRTEPARADAQRKYYLAHPFFQPLEGKFGSVTDLGYTTNSYGFEIDQTTGPALSDLNADWSTKQISVKEDISFGVTDNLAVMGMVRYDSSKYAMDWKTAPDDEMTDSGLNMYGLGLQWRFVDTPEWIANFSGYYQKQTDMADFFTADLKAGYKIGSSTIYGLVRGWMVNFDKNSYGNGISNDNAALLIAYKTGDNNATYFEGGAGVFTVLDKDWTLNVEGMMGNYDWHNQGSIKAAVGWQPKSSFALNFYVKTAVYDSADGQKLGFWWYQPSAGLTEFTKIGTAKIDGYSETSMGVQGILYF